MRICVVGGGIVGLSTALYLARKAANARGSVSAGRRDLVILCSGIITAKVAHQQ